MTLTPTPAPLTPLPMLVDEPTIAALPTQRFPATSDDCCLGKPWIDLEVLSRRYKVNQIPAGHPGVNELDHEAEPRTPAEVLVHPPLVKAAEERYDPRQRLNGPGVALTTRGPTRKR